MLTRYGASAADERAREAHKIGAGGSVLIRISLGHIADPRPCRSRQTQYDPRNQP